MSIDPYIFLRGYRGPVDPTDVYARAAQLRQMQRSGQLQDQQLQEGQMRLADLMRLQDQRAAMENAAKGAVTNVTPQSTPSLAAPAGGSDPTVPQANPMFSPTVSGPTTQQFDPNKYANNLNSAGMPLEAANYQAQQAAAAAAQKHQDLLDAKTLSEIDNNKLEHSLKVIGAVNQVVGGIRMAPPEHKERAYAHAVGGLIHAGVLEPGHPTQYPGDDAIEQQFNQGLTIEQQLQKEKDTRDFAYKQQHDTAELASQKRGQDITVRGQNMVDNRERDRQQALTGGPTNEGLVDQIGQGKMALGRLDYLITRNPDLAAQVSAKYPDFDSSKVRAYIDTTKDFTSGKTSVVLNAGGTALRHLAELKDLNTNTSRIPGTEDYQKYQNKVDTVSSELARFYAGGTAPTKDEISTIKGTLNATFNRDAAITTQAKSMGDKLDSYEQTWQNAAPSKHYQAPMPGISPEAIAARAKLDSSYKGKTTGNGYWNQFPEHN